MQAALPIRPARMPAIAVLLGCVALTLSGCGGKPIQSETLVKSAPPEQAMIMPPPAGPAIISVIERRFNNAVAQDVHLATNASTSGQNMFKIEMFGTDRATRYGDNSLGLSSVSEGRIAAEMRASLPRVRMVRSQFFVQNNYGPFGYAFGRGAGSDLCLYAWQQIRSDTGTVSPLANHGMIQVRLRLCEANATEARLLSTMYNFTITGAIDAKGWNPYGAPRSPDPAIGTGTPIYPRATLSEPIVQSLPPRRTVSYAPRAQTRQVRAEPAQVQRPVGEPDYSPQRPRVPAPTGAGFNATEMPTSDRSGGYPTASPSDTATYQGPRVTVPSPSCTMAANGPDVVCR